MLSTLSTHSVTRSVSASISFDCVLIPFFFRFFCALVFFLPPPLSITECLFGASAHICFSLHPFPFSHGFFQREALLSPEAFSTRCSWVSASGRFFRSNLSFEPPILPPSPSDGVTRKNVSSSRFFSPLRPPPLPDSTFLSSPSRLSDRSVLLFVNGKRCAMV
eukprot:RCo027675